jgi:tRNA pseudouridine13 synthase
VTPRAYGPAALAARYKAAPEDFVVHELPAFAASGAGEHLLLTVEKRGLATPQAARRIAAWAGVGDVDVGIAGMKDKHAVTRQRFSVKVPIKASFDLATLAFEDAGAGQYLRVLEAPRHARKLPRGAHAGNAFRLVLREVEGDPAAIEARLRAIAGGGLPNYFGEQRFGRRGDNVEQARRLFAGARFKREERSLLLSAARSELFNAVLAARVARGDWADGVDGDMWMLEGTHSVFGPQPLDEALRERAQRLDVHPTGPLWGRGASRAADAARAVEDEALAPHADLRAGLEAAGMNQERRALRVRVADLAWDWPEPGVLRLTFALPPGSYATALLAELGDCRDA